MRTKLRHHTYVVHSSIALQDEIGALALVVVRPLAIALLLASALRVTNAAHTREAAPGPVPVLRVTVATVRRVVTGAAIGTAVTEAVSDPVVAQ